MKALLITSLILFASCSSIIRPPYDYLSLKADDRQTPIAIAAHEEVDSFVDNLCKTNTSDECNERFMKMLHARMADKYRGVMPEAIEKTCVAYPTECQNPVVLERIYIGLHNRRVDQFRVFNEKWGEDDLQTEWRRYLAPPSTTPVVNNYHSTPVQQPVYQNPNVLPPAYRAPTHYQTNCQTYSWGTQCDTNGR